MAGDSSCHFFSHFGNHAKLLQFVGAVVMPTSENDRRRIPMASRSYQDLVAWQKSMAFSHRDLSPHARFSKQRIVRLNKPASPRGGFDPE